MKKAKIMLSALSIMGVLAVAFAFKTAKFETHFIYTGTKGTGSCTILKEGAAISNGTAAVAASTASVSSGCPDVFTVTVTD